MSEWEQGKYVIRHRRGSKAHQVEQFAHAQYRELTLGRDPSCPVRFDPERDDLVSREHVRIGRDPNQPGSFQLTDLGSRNGTFLNKQRVSGTVPLSPGDIIELGAGGPELEFDLDPRPAGVVRATRIAATGGAPVAATREAAVATQPAPTGQVGRATVERLIGQAKSDAATQSRRSNLKIGGALLLLVALVAAFMIYRELNPAKRPGDEKLSPAQIAAQSSPATVYVECWWKLILTQTGGQVYHQYIPNPARMPDGRVIAFNQINGNSVPAYVDVGNNSLEPLLTLEPAGVAIVGGHTGSGFFVSSDGFILTNRHVAAAWLTSFTSLPEVGVLTTQSGIPVLDASGAPIYVRAPMDWVPAMSRQAGTKTMGGLEGQNDVLDITFANQRQRTPAKLSRVSDEHDVALLKIDLPEPVPHVTINDNYDSIQAGDRVYVLGYPGISPQDVSYTQSKDAFVSQARVRVIPSPTLSEGLVGKVLRPGAVGAVGNVSGFNDAYQLTINSTGGGNSGGPMFDDQGRVTGIFYASTRGDAMITFSVPIRYGKRLMGAN
jgi:S1-C subfamily serine protease